MPDYRRRAVRERMTVRLDVNGMMSEALGDRGLTREEVEAIAPRGAECVRSLQRRLEAGQFLFYERSGGSGPLKEISRLAAEVREQADAFVVLAMGSTAPGIKTLLGALADGKMPAYVIDNVDPARFGESLAQLDLTRTVFNVISRSGDTADTIAQFLIVRDRLLRLLGAVDYKQHVVVTTDGEGGGLRQIVNDEGFRDVVVPPGVVGRFSLLSSVGLFPAAVAGVAIDDLTDRDRARLIVSDAPLLEGALAAAVRAGDGAPLTEVAAAADGALAADKRPGEPAPSRGADVPLTA